MWLLWLSRDLSIFVQNLQTSQTRQILLFDLTKGNFLSCRDNKTEHLTVITIWSRKCTRVNSSAATTRSYQSDIRELIHVSDLWSPCGNHSLFQVFLLKTNKLLIFHIRVIECHNTACSHTLTSRQSESLNMQDTHTHSPPASVSRCTCKLLSEQH